MKQEANRPAEAITASFEELKQLVKDFTLTSRETGGGRTEKESRRHTLQDGTILYGQIEKAWRDNKPVEIIFVSVPRDGKSMSFMASAHGLTHLHLRGVETVATVGDQEISVVSREIDIQRDRLPALQRMQFQQQLPIFVRWLASGISNGSLPPTPIRFETKV